MKSKFVGHLSFALRRPCHNYLRTDWADFFSKFKLLLALGHTPNFFFWISKKQKNKRPWNLAIIGWLWSGLLVSKSSWKWFRVSSRWKQQPMDADEVIRNRGLPVSDKSLVIAIAYSDARTCGACRTESLPIELLVTAWYCNWKSACRS